jgi:hypothetical protein
MTMAAWVGDDQRIRQLERENEILRIELDNARSNVDRLVKLLGGIFTCLGPAPVTVEGQTYTFVDPDPARTLKVLQERIRRVPEQVRLVAEQEQPVPPAPSRMIRGRPW